MSYRTLLRAITKGVERLSSSLSDLQQGERSKIKQHPIIRSDNITCSQLSSHFFLTDSSRQDYLRLNLSILGITRNLILAGSNREAKHISLQFYKSENTIRRLSSCHQLLYKKGRGLKWAELSSTKSGRSLLDRLRLEAVHDVDDEDGVVAQRRPTIAQITVIDVDYRLL